MSESFVVLSRAGKPSQRRDIRINGRDPTFIIKGDEIEGQLVSPMTDVLEDLLEIASAVFFADTSFRRGGDGRPRLGEGWHRQLGFHLCVRRPDLWSREDVCLALVDAVRFLTDDRVSSTFASKERTERVQPYLPFDRGAKCFKAEEVILFSGGLDSFAGALDALNCRPGKVILVTHRSAPKAITRQVDLGKFLKKRFGGRVLHIHVRATRSRAVSSESTQRSRSFLFSALGYVVARMAEADRISFYENGVVSHNLPVSPQVVGTMASRTTHPLSLRKLRTFFDLLGEPRIGIHNGFEWLTKTDILKKIHEIEGSKGIELSVSCTSLRSEAADLHHCGSCSQCFDRRFAVLAAGLEAYDHAGDYRTDVLTGARVSDRSRTMAIEWTRHACRLAGTDITEFAQRFASDLVRIVAAYDEHSSNAAVEKVFDLHRRHGAAVMSVIERAIRGQAALIARGQLPPTSLLSMYLGEAGFQVPDVTDDLTIRTPAADKPPSAYGRGTPPPELFPLRVAFYQHGTIPVVEVDGLGCVRHGPAAVAHDLRPFYDEDLAAGLAPENHRYVPRGGLATKRRHVAPNTVSQQVNRCRNELAAFYRAVERKDPDRDLLIENIRHKGYRLDPTIRVIRHDQVRQGAKG